MPYQMQDYNKELTEWQYIEKCLYFKKMTIDDLGKFFGVTKQRIADWKKGAPISKEKKIFLAKFFGVTLDEFYNKEFSHEYFRKLIYNLEYMLDEKNYKRLTYDDIQNILFDAYIKCTSTIEMILNEDFEKDFVSKREFNWFCQKLQVSYSYEINDSIINGTSYLDFDTLIQIKKELKECYGNINLLEKFHYKTIDLIEIILRSEEIKAISEFAYNDVFYTQNHSKDPDAPIYLDPKKYMDKYVYLKEQYKDFDLDGEVLKTLIAEGIIFWIDDKPDYEKTFNYLKNSIRHEIYEKYIEEE